MIKDANGNFMLPDMGDFYYDAPDQEAFYKELDKQLNPNDSDPKTAGMKAKFYLEDPPEAGYKPNTNTYVIDVKFEDSAGSLKEPSDSLRGIYVSDGDTIELSVANLNPKDKESADYIDQIKKTCNNQAYAAGAKEKKDYSKIELRFACMDAKELPHFIPMGNVKNFANYETKTFKNSNNEKEKNKFQETLKDNKYIISKYKCYLDEPEPNSVKNTDAYSRFYKYDRELSEINVVKLPDGKYHQYFDKVNTRYICVKSDVNDYTPETIRDAGIARDTVVSALNGATDMRIMLSANSVAANKNLIKPKFGNDIYSQTDFDRLLNFFFDNTTQTKNKNANPWGVDAYGRGIAAIYIKKDGKWINLNKMVIANTSETVPNAYGDQSSLSREFDENSYNYKEDAFQDSIYNIGKKYFDDRDKVQKDIFKQDFESLKDWTVTIGDVTLFVPPTSIRCLTQTKADRIPVVRAKGAIAKSSTKMQRILELDVFFNEDHGINGYKYTMETRPGSNKKETYWMNGLRALYAEFRLTPFLPIDNNYINQTLGIEAVTMINFSAATVPNFPRLIKVTIQLSDFDFRIYMPEIAKTEDFTSKDYKNRFSEQINYPLMRYYYQRLLQNGEKLKNVKFLDDLYIKSTFGNQTPLIPYPPIQNPTVRFYIPNKESLDRALQAKIARLSKTIGQLSLTEKEKTFATDIAKIDNELQYTSLSEDDPITLLNQRLRKDLSSLDPEYDSSGDMYLCVDIEKSHYQQKTGESTITFSKGEPFIATIDYSQKIKSNKVKPHKNTTEYFKSNIASASETYSSVITSSKNELNNNLCTKHGEFRFDNINEIEKSIKNSNNGQLTLKYHMYFQVNAPYISDNELKSLRTEASRTMGVTADEIFKNRVIDIPVSINLQKDEETGLYIAPLGSASKDLFSIQNNGDIPFIKMLSGIAAASKSGGTTNDQLNDIKASIDYVSTNSIIFEPYYPDVTFHAENMQISVSNSFSQITLQNSVSYAPQYMGGTDVKIALSMFTDNKEAAYAMNDLPKLAAEFAQEYRLVLTAWPLKFESEFTKLFGITDTMVETVQVNTVPNMPGLYQIELTLISVDRSLRNRESLLKADIKNNNKLQSIKQGGVYNNRNWRYNELKEFFAERELYPDLELPSLDELKEKGFAFIRYSNPKRKYPDPDFYFTYSYILVSQIIRETVLHMLEMDATLNIKDDTGKELKGKIGQGVDTYSRNFEMEPGWDMSTADAIDKELGDQAIPLKIISDRSKYEDDRRKEMWAITPELKVAFLEKRIFRKLYSNTKNNSTTESDRDINTKTSAEPTAEEVNKKIEEVTTKVENETNAPAADRSTNVVATPSNKIIAKHDAYIKEQKEKIDAILNNPRMQLDESNRLKEEADNIFGVTANYDTIESAKATLDMGLAFTPDINVRIEKWLEAAAAAIHSNQGVAYSSGQENEEFAPWTYRKAYRATCKYKDESVEDFDITINGDIDDTLKQQLKDISESAMVFGFFNFKFYTKEELENRFGKTYGSIEKDGKPATKRNGYEVYLADPGYRFESEEKINKYVYKCITDFEFARMSFLHICFMYYYSLLEKHVFPSFSYDIFKDSLTNKQRMVSVIKRMREIEKEELEKNAKGSTKDSGIATRVDNSTISHIDEQTAQKEIEQLYKEFDNNIVAVNQGKLFLSLCMGVLDGDENFTNILVNREIDTLNSITTATLGGNVTKIEKENSYIEKLNLFIKAACGTEAIDIKELGTGTPSSLGSTILQNNSKFRIAAAAGDPSQYLVHSWYDMVVHDCRGRMLRAFPTFYMVIIDEGRQIGYWKLHDNFYNVNSIASLTISRSRKLPTETAEIVLTNYFQTFTTEDEDLNMGQSYTFSDVFDSIFIPFIKPITEEYASQEEQRRNNAQRPERIRLKPGARIHLRLGYGSDASHIPIAFNGLIAEIDTGDVVKLICQSDGVELCNPMMFDIDAYDLRSIDSNFSRENFGNSDDTPKNIIRHIMTMKGGYINKQLHEAGYTDEQINMIGDPINPFGIYHFGNPDEPFKICGESEPTQNVFEIGVKDIAQRYGLKDPDCELPKINFKIFGKTVWDAIHICKSLDPSYICAVLPFNMRSTLFFGRSHDYYAYDYVSAEGGLFEKRKPFQQFHLYKSNTDIINNTMAVSTKDIATCAVGIYQVHGCGGDAVTQTTDPQWFDQNVFPEFQKTMYVDTQLYGMGSRRLSGVSDLINYVGGDFFNSSKTFDRAFDEKGWGKSHHKTAVRMTINALKSKMKEMYQGQITLIGDPSVKPQDRFQIMDTFNGIAGQCTVRDVVQVFSPDQGFKTVITPDLIVAQRGAENEFNLQENSMGALASRVGAGAVVGLTTGMAAGAAIGTVTLPIIGTITGTAIGATVGLISGGLSTVFIGGETDSVVSMLESRKRLTIFPVMKYNKPMVGGIDGHVGTVYGSPTFGKLDSLEKMIKDREGITGTTASAILEGIGWFTGEKNVIDDTMAKSSSSEITESEKQARKTLKAVSDSSLERFSKLKFNPNKPRMQDINKSTTLEKARHLYGVTENTHEGIYSSQKLQSMMFVPASQNLRTLMDLGFFRVAGTEKGFTSDLNEKIKCLYLPNPEKQGEQIYVNAIKQENNGKTTYDIPYLQKDAIQILEEIIEKTITKLMANGKNKDRAQWCKDNEDNFVCLTSALVCGGEKYSNTGYSFVITASKDDSAKALYEATSELSQMLDKAHEKKAAVVNNIISANMEGTSLKVVIHPPEG